MKLKIPLSISGFSSATLQLVQTGATLRERHTLAGTTLARKTDVGEVALDIKSGANDYRYPLMDPDDRASKVFRDTPGELFDASGGDVQLTVEDWLTIWGWYQPASAGSIPVATWNVEWGWTGEVHRDLNVPEGYSKGNCTPLAYSVTENPTDLPEWTRTLASIGWQQQP